MMIARVLVSIATGVALAACGDDKAERDRTAAQLREAIAKQEERAAAVEREKQRTNCLATLEEKKLNFSKYIKAAAYAEAVLELEQCAPLLNDPELLSQLRKADIKKFSAQIDDIKKSYRYRALALDSFTNKYPDEARQFAYLLPQLHRKADEAERIEEARRRRREGVRIGMTSDEVVASSWGRPEKINRTTNAWGTREQWVYGGGNYLYFEDGVLTSIQH